MASDALIDADMVDSTTIALGDYVVARGTLVLMRGRFCSRLRTFCETPLTLMRGTSFVASGCWTDL